MRTLLPSPNLPATHEHETDSSGSGTGSDVKQRDIADKDYQTMTWLECTAVPPGNKLVDKLKCKVCTKYMDRLEILDHWSCFFENY